MKSKESRLKGVVFEAGFKAGVKTALDIEMENKELTDGMENMPEHGFNLANKEWRGLIQAKRKELL